MATVRVNVAPDLLQWAVGRAGWDEETAQKRAPKLEAWSSGDTQPTLKQLEQFANATHTPFGMLFLPDPPVEEVPIPDMRTIGNTAVQRPSADLLETIYLCQDRQDWYRDYARENDARPLPFIGSATTATEPEQVAADIRRMLRFETDERGTFSSWEDALRRLIDRIEGLGVLVMVSGIAGANTHRILRPDEFRGFALSDPVAPLIFVNGADTKAAQIFTIIHELAHLWLGESALSDAAMTTRAGVVEELWCNQVSAAVLIPGNALRSEYRGGPAVAELERLARRYRVSTLVVLKRIFDVGLLDWDTYRRLFEDEKARVIAIFAARKGDGPGGGNYYYTQPLMHSMQFAHAVLASTLEGGTSYRDAYRLLGTRKHETFTHLAAELGRVS